MAVEAINAEKLAAGQRQAIARFFGAEIPAPPDRLFEVAERIREERLFRAEPFYLPKRSLAAGLQIPGLKVPLDPWLNEQIREGKIAQDADMLSGQWVIFDVSGRPNYDNGRQMYSDSNGLGEILADLRDQGKIEVPDYYRRVPKNSRFAVSADEIDGSGRFVADRVVAVLGLQADEIVTTPPYVVINYIGNLAHPEFGQANTSEWFADKFGRGDRLYGGLSGYGGLSRVYYWPSDYHYGLMGFRLQVSFPS